jgi:hypothetical protein
MRHRYLLVELFGDFPARQMSFQGHHKLAVDIECCRRKHDMLRPICQFHLLALGKDGKDQE